MSHGLPLLVLFAATSIVVAAAAGSGHHAATHNRSNERRQTECRRGGCPAQTCLKWLLRFDRQFQVDCRCHRNRVAIFVFQYGFGGCRKARFQ